MTAPAPAPERAPVRGLLGPRRGTLLLAIARRAVAEALGVAPAGGPVPAEGAAEACFEEPRATFVTLHDRQGELRGCIGSLEPRRPLAGDVAHNARAAALGDPRFPSVCAEELGDLLFEVSVLGPLEPIPCHDRETLLSHLRPGVDGLVLECGPRRATFLPQVWDTLPEPEAFLAALERKAGLPEAFWVEKTRCWRYRVEEFAESPETREEPGATRPGKRGR